MIKRYKSSKKAGAFLAIFLLALIGIVLIVNAGETATKDLIESIVILIAVFGFLVVNVLFSRIEIDDEKRTVFYRNGIIKSKAVPIDKIIQVGYPKQNYIIRSVNSFLYVWYDDPDKPGRDAYVKIRDAQFAPQTLAEMGRQLKSINEDIKFDNTFSRLLTQQVK
jgi:hypothetical protein